MGNKVNNNGVVNAFTSDGESRQSAGEVTYVCDGEGRRVEKTAGTFMTYYVYDAGGEAITESTTQTEPYYGTEYVTGDHLGSTRLLTNATGGVIRRFDYLPFGEEIPSGLYGRGSDYGGNSYPNLGVAGDETSRKFTGKERDAETGLDYFGARYFSGAQGRFISPDWAAKSEPVPYANLEDPQTLNLYGYVRNNPLAKADADGHEAPPLDADQVKSVASDISKVSTWVRAHPKLTEVLLYGAGVLAGALSEGALPMEDPVEIPTQVGQQGAPHAPGDVIDSNVVVRGGASDLPTPGTKFSGSQGATTHEAAAAVPHGQIRETTAADIRGSGGNVRPDPAATRAGTINGKHVNVTEGNKSTFGPVKPNPVPKKERIE